MTNAEANRLPGLASGINTDQVIGKIMAVEQRRLQPMQDQRAGALQELQAFDLINQALENINGTVDSLKGASIWDGKIIDSSNEDVVTATATSGAKPGKHTLVVDRLALNHQIASQGYAAQEDQVGTGRMTIRVGDGSDITVVIDESTNSLTGLKDAINFATDEVNATIIKTGNRNAPYQLVLTSQQTGSDGRIALDVQLKGGITPNFQNSVEEPSAWAGVGEPEAERGPAVTGTGASTAIVDVIGEYAGEEDNRFSFQAIQTGIVGGDKQLQLRWTDESGRSGVIKLDELNYAPGEPLEFVDGLALVFSEGEIVVNDRFSFDAQAERSDLTWWVAPEARGASVSRPSAWQRQQTGEFGAPVIEGDYTGEDDQTFTLTVQGSGQVGRAQDLSIFWEGSEGQSGSFSVGQGYEPGTPLALTDGLTLSMKPGVLNSGQVATFEVEPSSSSSRWWLTDSERRIPPEILNVTPFGAADPDEDEGMGGVMPDLPEGAGPRVSTVPVVIGGAFDGDEAKVYTFTALRDGAVGTTKKLRIQWDDSKGNTGELAVDETYEPGTPVPFAEGMTVTFGEGRLFKDDTFTVRTRTSTVQPPQDALIRFGATELGGGLEITSSTNEMDGVIDGVRLNLVSSSERPVTITIRGDTETATESVKTFVQQYNELSALIAELTKFDKENEIAGPLLGNRDVADIQNTLAELLIDPVAGLPKSTNMLLALGVSFNDSGLLDLDESKLQAKIQEDFSVVSNLFRNRGESDNSNVAFVGMTDDTQISTDGFPVDIESIATQGYYETPPLPGTINISGDNGRFFVSVDGRQSEQIVIGPGSYSLNAYARALQDAITNDEVVGQRRVRVTMDGNQLKVTSGRYGSGSSIAFLPVTDGGPLGPGLFDGQSVTGADVVGTINGKVAEGNGQLLRAPDDSGPASGLRVYVKLTESQMNEAGPEASVVVTKGIASRVSKYLGTIVNPLTGQMRRITQNLREQVGDLDGQLNRLEERIAGKRDRLQERFARLENQMSTLKSQQAYMQSQLGGGGAGIPGLPGL